MHGGSGIGKATLAYRLARFVLAHPDPQGSDVQSATSLAVAPDHPVARRIAVQAQGDLLVLERVINEQITPAFRQGDYAGGLSAAVRVLGGRCVLAAVQAPVASALVDLDIDLAGVEAFLSTEEAIDALSAERGRAP